VLKDKADRLRRESKDATLGIDDGSSSHSTSSSDDERNKKAKSGPGFSSSFTRAEGSSKPHGHP
jgi:hypothetical protein